MRLKTQSAMEYLMTYGWAILIIAVVLGALFGLGFFNSTTLAPKVSAGSCQVYRPFGPGTVSYVNLQGTCNNELPQYAAQFNGQSSYIVTGTSDEPLGSSPRSAFAWVYISSYFGSTPSIFAYGNYGSCCTSQASGLQINGGTSHNLTMYSYSNNFKSGLIVSSGSWHFVGYTYASNSLSATVYLDGQSQTGTLSGGVPLNTVLASINASTIGVQPGTGGGSGHFCNCLIANVQVYNTSLSANEVTALYDEGIGGVPISPQYIVGWWPLNGNANDYSGNLNNGSPTNIVFTSSWTSGYSAP
ncbi:MAG TPA: LamG-like jellyroll fold domain-containing protein [Candidatus Saccharimonadales bacterium]|nr:LamG-like jellyroll fold domain-containing protein [Candidatus Saccharimonadales bacterium]